MSADRETVDFSYQDFDPKYLESLSHDFYKFDTNGDGRLDKKEFVQWLVEGGTKEKAAKNLFYVADTNNDGSLSLDEFKRYAQLQQNMILKGDVEEYVRNVYNSVKARGGNHSGLNKKEFVKFMELMNTPVSFFKKGKIFKEYDTDGSGTIEFDELMRKIYFRRSALLDSTD
ncbi:hypothetical protein M9Y10_009833 [Tritrichomonas musculus]|uniref:EF-hand domain-containing protein n=1 Tax=Tritrichomonas musculus TaxID=1915356 RepID=A0ABR2IQN0_9EUKA